MNLEYTILEHLIVNDNGKFVDITLLDEDYSSLIEALIELRGKNRIVLDETKQRDFTAFGISNQRKHHIRAKINMRGKVYYQNLNNKINKTEEIIETKRIFKLVHFFNF